MQTKQSKTKPKKNQEEKVVPQRPIGTRTYASKSCLLLDTAPMQLKTTK